MTTAPKKTDDRQAKAAPKEVDPNTEKLEPIEDQGIGAQDPYPTSTPPAPAGEVRK